MRAFLPALLVLMVSATPFTPARASSCVAYRSDAAVKATTERCTVDVDVDVTRRLAAFEPRETFGQTVDKEPAGTIAHLYSPRNIHQIEAAGWGWLSYRLFTELSVQDWHWNPLGTFSNGTQGYWSSSGSTARAPIADSFGYRLAHRGSTSDQGNNEDYSRLDDGDAATYWKSDPYLTRRFTHEADDLHPQWAMVDLGSRRLVDGLRVVWANPYATRYDVQYWTGDDAINEPGSGAWRTFESGAIVRGAGGTVTLPLTHHGLHVRFVRLLMYASSGTCDTHGRVDSRNCVGYAVGELSVGHLRADGSFIDAIHHAPCGGEKPGTYACGVRQTATYVSSVDPWHRVRDRVRNQEQPGLDLIARSGLTRGTGAMYPVPMLYSTPQNAVAEVRYLRARHYPIADVELGEEPDGQYVQPEDYAALYIQWAHALHAVDPTLALGGPVFSGVNADLQWWPDAHANTSFLNRFLHYLRVHGALSQLAFMSFEHYPFDGCEHGAALHADLLREPAILSTVIGAWHADGVPPKVPLFITEANFSAVNYTATPMRIEGALWLVDYLAGSVARGVRRVVYYQDEPVPLSRNTLCPNDYGNLTMFNADAHGHIRSRTAQFYAAQMIMRHWLDPAGGRHELYASSTSLREGRAPLMTSYAVHRPGGAWSIMLVNKDRVGHAVRIRIGSRTFVGRALRVTYGPAQYRWHARGARSFAAPNEPPDAEVIGSGRASTYFVPALSLAVVRGSLSP